MGRPAGFDRSAAVQTAMQIFLDRGYEGTSIEDLTTELGISRASLYNAFGDKHGLLLETFCCAEKCGADMRLAALGCPGPVRDVLRSFFEQLIANKRGCFFLTLGAELSSADRQVRKRVRGALDASRRMFRDLMIRAQESGEVSRSKDPDVLSAMLLGAMVSTLTLNRLYPERELVDTIFGQALACLD